MEQSEDKSKINLKRYIPEKGNKSYLIKFAIYAVLLVVICLYFIYKLNQSKGENPSPDAILNNKIELEIEQ